MTDQDQTTVRGQPINALPDDLYIPPDALEVFLEAFSGPLDLLLYLIKRQNIDVLDIPIADITRQYMEYIELMQEMRFELAAEYLLMAAMLAEIKSKMLLPRSRGVDETEEDPRAELVRRLQEYERYQQAAEMLDELPRCGRDTFQVQIEVPAWSGEKKKAKEATLQELLLAFNEVLKRVELHAKHQVMKEPLSIRERMRAILSRLSSDRFLSFGLFFNEKEGRSGVVVTFLAILQLFKNAMIEVVQTEAYASIYIKAA